MTVSKDFPFRQRDAIHPMRRQAYETDTLYPPTRWQILFRALRSAPVKWMLVITALLFAFAMYSARADDWRGNERDMDTVRERARPVYDAAKESANPSGPAYSGSRTSEANGRGGWSYRCVRDRYGQRAAGC
jgi:hypothetical protein